MAFAARILALRILLGGMAKVQSCVKPNDRPENELKVFNSSMGTKRDRDHLVLDVGTMEVLTKRWHHLAGLNALQIKQLAAHEL